MKQLRQGRWRNAHLLFENVGDAADFNKLNFGFIAACLEK